MSGRGTADVSNIWWRRTVLASLGHPRSFRPFGPKQTLPRRRLSHLSNTSCRSRWSEVYALQLFRPTGPNWSPKTNRSPAYPEHEGEGDIATYYWPSLH